MNENDYYFFVAAFLLLGIERILYGYWFLYPQEFMRSVRQGIFKFAAPKNTATTSGNNGSRQQENDTIEYWKAAMTLGLYVKVFQFAVAIYDLMWRNDSLTVLKSYWAGVEGSVTATAIAGLVLFAIGQGLNYSVFCALGCKGVYYAAEFGENMSYVSCFPYNLGISDPQYWGVVLCIWGIYFMLQAKSLVVPLLETFWYLVSMHLLEHQRGRKLLALIDRRKTCYSKSQ